MLRPIDGGLGAFFAPDSDHYLTTGSPLMIKMHVEHRINIS
jgi:hypothetical protein